MIKDFCTGVQHIGIPTNDIAQTRRFFTSLGFTEIYSTVNDGQEVAFLVLGNLTIETWQTGEATGEVGAIDHISIDVRHVDDLLPQVRAAGYEPLEGHVCQLPYWERGIRYFTIMGPDKEKIEFCEKL